MESKNNDKKGFGGFEDLVSDVTKEVEIPVQKLTPKTAHVPFQIETRTQQSSPPSVRPPQSVPAKIPQNTSRGNGSAGAAWFWVIAIIVVIVALSNSGKKDEGTPPAYLPSNQQSYNPPAPIAEAAAPAETPIDPQNPEELPPVGSGLLLSDNQIRYCLSMDVRLDAIKGAIDSYSQFEVDTFNSAISYQNSRCSNFKYRRGSLESIRSEVNQNNASLVTEGLRTLAIWRAQVAPPASPAIEPPAATAPETPTNAYPESVPTSEPSVQIEPEPATSE